MCSGGSSFDLESHQGVETYTRRSREAEGLKAVSEQRPLSFLKRTTFREPAGSDKSQEFPFGHVIMVTVIVSACCLTVVVFINSQMTPPTLEVMPLFLKLPKTGVSLIIASNEPLIIISLISQQRWTLCLRYPHHSESGPG